jgi:hypothetical protein
MQIAVNVPIHNECLHAGGSIENGLHVPGNMTVHGVLSVVDGFIAASNITVLGDFYTNPYHDHYCIIGQGTNLRFSPSSPREYSVIVRTSYPTLSGTFFLNRHAHVTFAGEWSALRNLPELVLNGGRASLRRVGTFTAQASLAAGVHITQGGVLDVGLDQSRVLGTLTCLNGSVIASDASEIWIATTVALFSKHCTVASNATLRFDAGSTVIETPSYDTKQLWVTGGYVDLIPGINLPFLTSIRMTGGVLTLPAKIGLNQLSEVKVFAGTLRSWVALDVDHLQISSPGSAWGILELGEDASIEDLLLYGGYLRGLRNDVNVSIGSQFQVLSAADKYIESCQLTLPDSNTTHLNSGSHFYVSHGASITVPNNATLAVLMSGQSFFSSSTVTGSPEAMLINHGQLVFTRQYRESILELRAGLISSGNIHITGGELRLSYAVLVTGNVTIDHEAQLQFFSYTSTGCTTSECGFQKYFTPTSRLLGSGFILAADHFPVDIASSFIDPRLRVRHTAGGITYQLNAPLYQFEPITISSGVLSIDGSKAEILDLSILGGTVTLKQNAIINSLTMTGGELHIQGDVQINNMRWLGGNIYGAKTNNLHIINMSICGSTNHLMYGLNMQWSNQVEWSGTGNLAPYEGSTVSSIL